MAVFPDNGASVPGNVQIARSDRARPGFGQKLFRSISTPRIVVAGLFASTVAFMLLLAGDGMEILTSVRGFVEAEGHWATSQKEAILHLRQYAVTHDEEAWRQYRQELAVLLDFGQVRRELSKPNGDRTILNRMCQAHGISSADLPGMVDLFRRFKDIDYVKQALQIWENADQHVNRLADIGQEIRADVIGGKPDAATLAAHSTELDTIDRELAVLETSFAATFGDAARWARDLFKWTIAISAALLLTLGILITWRLLSDAIEAREKYRQLIDTANDAILVAHRESGRIIQANLKAEALTGLPASDLVGRRLQDFVFSEPETAISALLQGEPFDPVHPPELHVTDVNGRATPVEASVNLTTFDGKVVVQSLLRDLSDRRRLEAQLRQAAKMDAVGRLAGGVAHDFNNLLTVISGYAELILTQTEENDSTHSSIEQIIKAADRASSLTQQLLAFSRHRMMKPKVLDLNETIAGVEKMLRRLIGENISLEFTPGPGLGHIKADPSQMEQVIVNLVVNARDAMPNGGRLQITTFNTELTEKMTHNHPFLKPGSYVALKVTDNGMGMDEKTASCIFEPFFTTKESGKGTGLGLAMVYGTVKQTGGYVLVDSEVGKGTTFDLYLPRVYAAKTPDVQVDVPAPSGGVETILVVEDQAELRSLLQTVLQRNGYRVLEASDGKHALTKFREHHRDISLVITDMVMPEMGGLDLGVHLRAMSESLKILYISGYTDSLLPKQTLPRGVAFLQKPFTPDILSRTVREVLDGSVQNASTPV